MSGAAKGWQSFIGLEIHIRLATASKIFCSCPADSGSEPNTNVCPICLGYPGVLPVLNLEALRHTFLVVRALKCRAAECGVFERKNYFYPDMTKNYQISQFRSPFGTGGSFSFETGDDDAVKSVRIHDVHLEEDAGKMIHRGGRSLLDYNRAGSSLLEIVTEPDFTTGEEAEAFLQAFRRMVRYLGVCDGNMEEGHLRCDANVSVNRQGAGLGRKVEIKNLNSSRFVRMALNHEIKRQTRLLKGGGTVIQETRLWDEARGVTESMRSKEEAQDYRYFPEPDLPPFAAGAAFLDEVDAALPELPLDRKRRFIRDLGLKPDQAAYLTDEKETADFFEAVLAAAAGPGGTGLPGAGAALSGTETAAEAAKWIRGGVARALNQRGLTLTASSLTPERLAALIGLIAAGTLHGKTAAQTLEHIFDEDKDPDRIAAEQGWDAAADSGELEALVEQVIAENPRAADQIRGGDPKPRGFLMGKVMKATGGSADPKLVQTMISEKLGV